MSNMVEANGAYRLADKPVPDRMLTIAEVMRRAVRLMAQRGMESDADGLYNAARNLENMAYALQAEPDVNKVSAQLNEKGY